MSPRTRRGSRSDATQAALPRVRRPRRRRALAAAALLLAAAAWVGLGQSASSPIAEAPGPALIVETRGAEAAAGYDRLKRFVGRVEFAQASAVSFELGGQVERVFVEDGDRVDAGQALAGLDTQRLRARRAELVAERDGARAQLELAELRDARAQTLLREDVIPPQGADDTRLERAARRAALARVEAAIASIDVDLEKSVLRAPFPGQIGARRVDAGEVVRPGQAIVQLFEVGRPEVRVGVSRAVAREMAKGARLDLLIDGEPCPARVLAVLPERGAKTRTVAVRLALEEAAGRFHEGDLAELLWRERVDTPGFWLPRAALTEGARGLWAAYVAETRSATEPERSLVRRHVEILHEEGERVYVRGALRSGEQVVQSGVHRVVPGQRVRIAEPALARASAARAGRP